MGRTWFSSVIRCSSFFLFVLFKLWTYCSEFVVVSKPGFDMMSDMRASSTLFSCSICAYRSSSSCSFFTLRRTSPKCFGGLLSILGFIFAILSFIAFIRRSTCDSNETRLVNCADIVQGVRRWRQYGPPVHGAAC